MYKFALIASVLTTVVFTTVPVVTTQAQGFDFHIGPSNRNFDRDDYRDQNRQHRERGLAIGHCRMVTVTVQRDDGRTITRRERRCD
ncbi:MAG TPA: hypothetical protein VEP90_00585 [Methylomirabilota bacterium]|nr:hypothetical protein [Methylomirabilota bacterium]